MACFPSLRFAGPIIVCGGAMRNTAERIAGSIDRVIAAIGRAATWCCLYIVLAEFAVVVMRYALGLGSIRLQESVLGSCQSLHSLGERNALFPRTEQKRHAQSAEAPRACRFKALPRT